jgi:hypothetical protein
MTIKASGRSALILSIGLWVCFAGPTPAAVAADGAGARPKATAPLALNKYAKHGPRHWKKVAHRKFGKLALKPATRKAVELADDDGDAPAVLPPSIANAKAQLASADTPASALSARANTLLQAAPADPAGAQPAADTQVVSSDRRQRSSRWSQPTRPRHRP